LFFGGGLGGGEGERINMELLGGDKRSRHMGKGGGGVRERGGLSSQRVGGFLLGAQWENYNE